MSIESAKQQSGALKFASVLGKSTIERESIEYKTIERITQILLENGYGVIHGGYAGWAMQAVSDTAAQYIRQHNLPTSLNIAVPQVQHDGLWERVSEAHFIDPTDDIFQRLKIVTSGDINVVCPLWGDGTELEETIVFHENVVKEGMNKYGGFNIPTTPLIFVQTPTGTDWKKLIETKLSILATSVKSIEGHSWLHFVDTLDGFADLLQKFRKEEQK